jgi:hypothetical protein
VARLESLEDRVVPATTPGTNVFLNAGALLTNVTATRTGVVPVFIDTGTLTGGAGGIQSATFYVRYDPAVLSINEDTVTPGAQGSDIQLGSLLSSIGSAGTYKVVTAAGFGPGVVGVGITNSGSAFFTGTAGGHLVELDFHVQKSASAGQSTLLDLVPSVPGHVTALADSAGTNYAISPILGSYAGTVLTQAGALTPATFNPPDADAADAAIQVVPTTLTVTGVAAGDKVYDATGKATLNFSGAAIQGLLQGDAVTLNTAGATATFASKDVGSGIKVTVSGLSLTGAAANQYTLTQPILSGNITPKPLTVNGVGANDKFYDSTTSAVLSTSGATLSGVANGDTVSLTTAGATGTFASKDVGKGVSVGVAGLTLGGAQAADYTVTQPTATANITPASLTVTGITVSNKVYDRTTAATLNTANAKLAGVLGSDVVTLSTAGATGTFASRDVGNSIAVTVSGLTIGGPQAGDYMLVPTPLAANITPAPVSVKGITAQDKVYDRTTAATINTSGATLVGVIAGDLVTLNTSGAVGNFVTKAVGQNITVNITGLTLGGPQGFDYTIADASTTANITPDLTLNLLTVAQGTPTPFNVHLVQVDHLSPPENVVYTVLTKPTGTLMDGTTKLDVGGTFTQADVNGGKVTYAAAAVGVESFQFSATDGEGGTVPATTMHIIVVKNFTEPPVHMTDKSLLEGTSGLSPFTFTVNLPADGTTANGPVTYDVFTTDGTAVAGVDYIPIYTGITAPNSSGTVTFAQGTNVSQVTVYVKAGAFAPTKITPTKNFTVSVANPNNFNTPLSTATATIIGQTPKPDHNMPTPKITDASVVVGKSGLTPITFSVDLGAAVAQYLTYDVFTTDGTAHAFDNFVGLIPGASYPNSLGTVTFRPGITHADITLYAIGGSLAKTDGNKDFTITLSDPLNPKVALASAKGTLVPNNLQVAIGTPDGTPGGVTLTSLTQLAPLISAAEARWAAVGVPMSMFQGVRFTIAQLPGHDLGTTFGRTISLDADAAGFGWYIDPTPTSNAAFRPVSATTLLAPPGSAAAGHMDLLTVIAHELGHILNLPDVISGPDTLMTQGLTAGTRRLPTRGLLSTAMPLPAVESFSLFAPKLGKAGDDASLLGMASADALASLPQPATGSSSGTAAGDQVLGQPWFASSKNASVRALLQVFTDMGSESGAK